MCIFLFELGWWITTKRNTNFLFYRTWAGANTLYQNFHPRTSEGFAMQTSWPLEYSLQITVKTVVYELHRVALSLWVYASANCQHGYKKWIAYLFGVLILVHKTFIYTNPNDGSFITTTVFGGWGWWQKFSLETDCFYIPNVTFSDYSSCSWLPCTKSEKLGWNNFCTGNQWITYQNTSYSCLFLSEWLFSNDSRYLRTDLKKRELMEFIYKL